MILITGIFLSPDAWSQPNFIPGVVITNQGDTLHGQIDFRNRDKNPDKILFRKEGETTSTRYSPLDIQSFKVNNEVYVSAIVNMSLSSRKPGSLDDEADLKTAMDTTFLQALIQGDKSLYYLKNREGIENFYIRQGDQFRLLVYNVYKSTRENKIRINKKYVGQLVLYFNNASSIRQQIQKTDYNRTSLEKLFQAYYQQTSSAPKFQKKKDKGTLAYGIVAGVSISQVNFSGDGYAYLTSTDISPSVNPTAGLFLNFILPRSQEKWSIYNELNFNSYQLTTDFNGFYHDIYYTQHVNTELAFSYLSLNNMVRFRYPVRSCYLYINGGISNGIIIDETNHKTIIGKTNTTESKGLDDIKKHDFGYIGGIGLQYHHFSVDARYKRSGGFSANVTLSSPVSQYYFLLGYRF